MSDASKQDRIKELLRKSLLGEELIDTQFHLFSARSSSSGHVLKPRTLCANNVLLAKSSKYFLDLLSTDVNPSDPSLVDLMSDSDVPRDAQIDAYGYGSDSDLEECNDPIEAHKDLSAPKDDDDLSDDGSEPARSDMSVVSPMWPRKDAPFAGNKGGTGSVASSETAVQDTASDKTVKNHTARRLRSLASRHVLVKDAAFQTWYTLLNHLYTDKFNFSPLSSTTPGGRPHKSSTSSLDEPRCSAKSMYRLASKVGLDGLRDKAIAFIKSSLTEQNILKELSCSLVAAHAELREMELDVLYAHIGSSHIVAEFPALARRIANGELAHGADIIIGIHARLLRASRSPPPLSSPPPPPVGPREPVPIKADVRVRDVPKAESKDKTGLSQVDWAGAQADSLGFSSIHSGSSARVPAPSATQSAVPSAKTRPLAAHSSSVEPMSWPAQSSSSFGHPEKASAARSK